MRKAPLSRGSDRSAQGGLASHPQEHRDDGWERMPRGETVVFSRTMASVDWPGARIHADDLVGEVRRLKDSADANPLRTVGGLSIARQLTLQVSSTSSGS